MTEFLAKRLINRFFYSFIWLTGPSAFFFMSEIYKDQAKSSEIFFEMMGLTLLSIYSLWVLFSKSYYEISERERNYTLHIEADVLSKMNTDFSDLVQKPRNLINRRISRHDTYKTYYCTYCTRAIKREEFHHSSLATRNPVKTCIDCMKMNKYRFKEEVEYVFYFDGRLKDFLGKFNGLNQTYYPKTIIDTKNIERYFFESVKKLRK